MEETENATNLFLYPILFIDGNHLGKKTLMWSNGRKHRQSCGLLGVWGELQSGY